MGKFIAAMLCMVAVVCQAAPAVTNTSLDWEKEKIAGMIPVHDSYRNEQYGFGVSVGQTKAYGPANGDPNHGVFIVLGDQRTISVSAMYDAAFYGSAKSALNHWLKDEHPNSIKRSAAVLNGKRAEQAIWQTGEIITKLIVQRRNESDGILYELTLTTTKLNRNEDSKVFDDIVRTFKTYDLPK